MTVLVSGRRRGYSVRKAEPSGPIVVVGTTCDLCGLRFTEEHAQLAWISTGRWRSKVGICPECGSLAEFIAGYIPEAA